MPTIKPEQLQWMALKRHWLSIPEAQAKLKCSRAKILTMIKRRVLKAEKITTESRVTRITCITRASVRRAALIEELRRAKGDGLSNHPARHINPPGR